MSINEGGCTLNWIPTFNVARVVWLLIKLADRVLWLVSLFTCTVGAIITVYCCDIYKFEQSFISGYILRI
jgi:hypothetical protein